MLSVYKLFGHTLPWSGDKMHAHALPTAFPQKHVADCVLLENLLCKHFPSMENLRSCTNEEMFAFIAQSVYFSLGCVADMNRFLFGIESSRCSDDERSR